MKHDVAIVLGTGIRQDGVLPDSCISNVKTAIKLYQNHEIKKLIFSGKWAWNCKYTPPITEAEAMRQIAITSSVPTTDIFIDNQGITTGSNLCMVKERILIPNDYKKVVLVCISDVIQQRMELNLKMILGPDFFYDILTAQSFYTPEKYQELGASEARKLAEAQKFFENITPGDHQTIYRLGLADIER